VKTSLQYEQIIYLRSVQERKLAKIRLPDLITNCFFDDNEEYLHVAAFAFERPSSNLANSRSGRISGKIQTYF
jgi:myosin-crossreactive antigen